ncbi:hypothetical protein ACFPMF_24810 [Larkinella bovis]|uniref:Polysaccharide biosynthesis protein n=1 Tax=Larkinella bovis TaxID=683041 RepID=A0ABW0IGE7_9BACT
MIQNPLIEKAAKFLPKSTLKKGFWAVLDQGLFAGSNFFVGILLARWMNNESYGGFSIAYSTFLFIGAIHTAFISEPMTVYGSGTYQQNLHSYKELIERKHWLWTITTSILLLIPTIYYYNINEQIIAESLLGLALSGPCILHLWIYRKICYILNIPHLAAIGGIIYMAIFLITITTSKHYIIVTPFISLSLMGASSLIASNFIKRQLPIYRTTNDSLNNIEVTTKHYNYGKWALLASISAWIPANVYNFIIPISGDLSAVGSLKALMNLLMPILHFNAAITSLIIPNFVRYIKNNTINKNFKIISMYIMSISLLYWLILFIYGERIGYSLYAGRYTFDKTLFLLLGIIPILSSQINIYTSYLRAKDMPHAFSKAFLIGGIITVLIGGPLSLLYKEKGAIISIIITNTVLILLLWHQKIRIQEPNHIKL